MSRSFNNPMWPQSAEDAQNTQGSQPRQGSQSMTWTQYRQRREATPDFPDAQDLQLVPPLQYGQHTEDTQDRPIIQDSRFAPRRQHGQCMGNTQASQNTQNLRCEPLTGQYGQCRKDKPTYSGGLDNIHGNEYHDPYANYGRESNRPYGGQWHGHDTLDGGVNGGGLGHGMNMGLPHPPPDIKPDISALAGQQPGPGGYHHASHFFSHHHMMGSSQPSPSMNSPPPLSSPNSSMGSPPMMSMSTPASPSALGPNSNKHVCNICGDRASGKHYGVYSCEGCKGFFKRTVRKDLSYACRDDKSCIIDKRQRNRCQFCRYNKCLQMGMKREAVQEERQRVKEKGDGEVESTSGGSNDMPTEQILEAELAVEPGNDTYIDVQKDPVTNICQAADKQLFTLVEWAKRIPHFTELPLEDQVNLLRAGWNELLIAGFSHRSIVIKDGILLATGLHVHRSSAHQAGVGTIFDRVLTELVAKMREIKMDKTELGCLRAIVLFNPDVKGLQNVQEVESLREKVYASLEEYCKQNYADEPGRFAKLLLRLPALRSIGLKCLEHLFFFKLIGNTPIDTFLMEMLESPKS